MDGGREGVAAVQRGDVAAPTGTAIMPLDQGVGQLVYYKYMKTQLKPSTLHRRPTMPAVKIGVSRQVVIPKQIHDQLGLKQA